MIGKLKDKNALFLHGKIGNATRGALEYEFGVVEPIRHPYVTYPDGRTFFLPWEDVCLLAEQAVSDPVDLRDSDEFQQLVADHLGSLGCSPDEVMDFIQEHLEDFVRISKGE